MKKIVIIGGSGHAKVLISIIKELRVYQISGYLDNIDYGPILGVPYLGDDSNASELIKSWIQYCGLGIGKLNNSILRLKIYEYYTELGFSFPSIISLKANISENVKIGAGTVVMAGATINVDTTIGKLCIINTNSSVDHDCNIRDDVHIAPGVTICGNVSIENNVFIGAGSVIVNNLNVKSKMFFKAHSLVKK